MNNIPVNDVLNFFYSIFSKLFSFINANSIVKWFVFVPIAAAFLCVIFYFVFDVSHLLDDYKSKHQKYYKGSKNNDYNNRKYKNKSPVKYGEFKKEPSKKFNKSMSEAQKRDNHFKAKNIKPDFAHAPRSSAKFNMAFDIKYEDE